MDLVFLSLQKYCNIQNISEDILAYGDMISAIVIIGMGVYLLFMVFTDRIQLRKHIHEDKEHIHIWFGKSHEHNSVENSSSFPLGLLMGAGGVRGMLITLGAVQGGVVDLTMVSYVYIRSYARIYSIWYVNIIRQSKLFR